MFGISWIEFFLIAVIAVLVIGPKELPQAMYALGKIARKLAQVSGKFKDSFEELMREAELQDIENQANAIMGRDVDEVMRERNVDSRQDT